MVAGELIDIQAANTEVRERMKADLARKYADVCGAVNATAFEYAVHGYTQELTEIERKGRCLACGGPLVGEWVCVKCNRDNS
jgi:hypothetical protein